LRLLVQFLVLVVVLLSASALCPASAQHQLVEKRVDSISLDQDRPVTVVIDSTLSRPHDVTPAERQELENLRSQGVLADYVVETQINRLGKYFLVSCNSGGSADYACVFQAVQEGPPAPLSQVPGMRFEIPGDGCVYASGHNNTMFNLRRKLCLDGDQLREIDQPFHYVGLKSKAKRDLPFFSDLTMKRPVGTIPKGDFVEVLVASSDGSTGPREYLLVRDDRGLTGWINVERAQEAEDVEGLYFAGD
jgi:hypothetical protein